MVTEGNPKCRQPMHPDEKRNEEDHRWPPVLSSPSPSPVDTAPGWPFRNPILRVIPDGEQLAAVAFSYNNASILYVGVQDIRHKADNFMMLVSKLNISSRKDLCLFCALGLLFDNIPSRVRAF